MILLLPGLEGGTYSEVVCWAGSGRVGCWPDGAMNCAEWLESKVQTAGLPTAAQYRVLEAFWEAYSHDSRFWFVTVLTLNPMMQTNLFFIGQY